MPFVAVNKARRCCEPGPVSKAVRLRKPKPGHQDVRPPEQELRDAWAIAANNEGRFARAWVKGFRQLMTEDVKRDVRRALADNDIEGAIEAIPWFDPLDVERVQLWRTMFAAMRRAYADIVQEAGQSSANEHGFALGFRRVDLPPPEGAVIAKEVSPRVAELSVPIDPFSLEWIEQQAGAVLVDATRTQKLMVRDLIFRNFERGERPQNIVDELARSVGLTEKQAAQVGKRRLSALDAGLSEAEADRVADKMADELLLRRAKTIARTETVEAQSAGIEHSWQLASEEGMIRPGTKQVWVAAQESDRTCPICTELDEQERDVGEPFDSAVLGETVNRPPAHPQCLPGDATVLASSVSAASERRYDGDLTVIRTASGKLLPCTPNHPILGPRGWVPARALNVGDDVVCGLDGQRPAPLVDPNHEHPPAMIHEVADTFRRAAKVAAIPVPTAAEDFHGDGGGPDVAVVWADRLLGHDPDPASLLDHVGEPSLIRCLCGRALPTGGYAAAVLKRLLRAARGGIRGAYVPLNLLRRHLRHAGVHGPAAVAGLDTAIEKPPADHVPADAEGFGQRLLRDAGGVSLDKVVNVNVQQFQGHVYNLQTGSGAYLAQGLVTHNCRCVRILEFPG